MVIFSCDATPFGTSLKHKMNCQSLGVEIMLRWNILSNFSARCELPVLIGTPKRPHLQKATVSIFGMISTGHIPSICQQAFSPILELLMTFDPVEKLYYCFGTGLQSIPGTVHPERLTAGTYKSPIWKGKWMKWSSNPPWGHVPAVNLQGVYDVIISNGPPWLPWFGALKTNVPKGWLHEIAEFSQGAGIR